MKKLSYTITALLPHHNNRWEVERNKSAGWQVKAPVPRLLLWCGCEAPVVGGGTEQEFHGWFSLPRAILSRRCLRRSAQLALIELIANKKPRNWCKQLRELRYINIK